MQFDAVLIVKGYVAKYDVIITWKASQIWTYFSSEKRTVTSFGNQQQQCTACARDQNTVCRAREAQKWAANDNVLWPGLTFTSRCNKYEWVIPEQASQIKNECTANSVARDFHDLTTCIAFCSVTC